MAYTRLMAYTEVPVSSEIHIEWRIEDAVSMGPSSPILRFAPFTDRKHSMYDGARIALTRLCLDLVKCAPYLRRAGTHTKRHIGV